MKLIIAIIKPFKLEEVRDALSSLGVQGMTVSRGERLRPPEGPHRDLPRRRIHLNFLPKIKIEVAVAGRSRRPGGRGDRRRRQDRAIGDGKIFVPELEQAVRIRTGETDSDAL